MTNIKDSVEVFETGSASCLVGPIFGFNLGYRANSGDAVADSTAVFY